MNLTNLLAKSETFVQDLFSRKLSPDMFFHNTGHTVRVVEAATQIAQHAGLNKNETKVVQIAAWFHDTGYCTTYDGHEDYSIAAATDFLRQQHCDEKVITEIAGCIAATKVPQHPQNALQQVICDADMYHLSVCAYWDLSENLRREWESRLAKRYSDHGWLQANINFLVAHQYFTVYGQTVLQQKKLANIDALLLQL